ncbi:unnamed protein product, partial [Closterium sp. NIES-64]
MEYVECYGAKNWGNLVTRGLLRRSGKSCRLRWVNQLKPGLQRYGGKGCKRFTEQESNIVLALQETLGNKWAQIARHLPGRTDNDVKNFWNLHLKRMERLRRQREQKGGHAAAAESGEAAASGGATSGGCATEGKGKLESVTDGATAIEGASARGNVAANAAAATAAAAATSKGSTGQMTAQGGSSSGGSSSGGGGGDGRLAVLESTSRSPSFFLFSPSSFTSPMSISPLPTIQEGPDALHTRDGLDVVVQMHGDVGQVQGGVASDAALERGVATAARAAAAGDAVAEKQLLHQPPAQVPASAVARPQAVRRSRTGEQRPKVSLHQRRLQRNASASAVAGGGCSETAGSGASGATGGSGGGSASFGGSVSGASGGEDGGVREGGEGGGEQRVLRASSLPNVPRAGSWRDGAAGAGSADGPAAMDMEDSAEKISSLKIDCHKPTSSDSSSGPAASGEFLNIEDWLQTPTPPPRRTPCSPFYINLSPSARRLRSPRSPSPRTAAQQQQHPPASPRPLAS